MPRYARTLCWFRRDLRDFDHAALSQALHASAEVYCAFVFDREILDPLPDRHDRRVEFIRESVIQLDRALRARGGGLIVRHARAREDIPQLARALRAEAVFANRDYEPAATDRDHDVGAALGALGIAFEACKDHVILERDEVLAGTGRPYTVFTAYKRAWLAALAADPALLATHPTHAGRLAPPPGPDAGVPSLAAIGFESTDLAALGIVAGMAGARQRFAAFEDKLVRYREAREFPALDATSHLSVDLRFGTVSVRALAAHALERAHGDEPDGAATWLSELIWRDFFAQTLWHFPRAAHHALRAGFEHLDFGNDDGRFTAWREGRTGYPLVDAAMRQLNGTGFMHNRLRMVTASFLAKHLRVDWRWGERYFARKLIDYDLASNVGGWQWAASTGLDAQPWFRIFNPILQSQRYDAGGDFIRSFVPELACVPAPAIHAPWTMSPQEQRTAGVAIGSDYPAPIVEHGPARAAALAMYRAARPSTVSLPRAGATSDAPPRAVAAGSAAPPRSAKAPSSRPRGRR